MIKSKTVYYSQYDENEWFETLSEAETHDNHLKQNKLNDKLKTFIIAHCTCHNSEADTMAETIIDNWAEIYNIMVEKPIDLEETYIGCETCKYEDIGTENEPCYSCMKVDGFDKYWEPK